MSSLGGRGIHRYCGPLAFLTHSAPALGLLALGVLALGVLALGVLALGVAVSRARRRSSFQGDLSPLQGVVAAPTPCEGRVVTRGE